MLLFMKDLKPKIIFFRKEGRFFFAYVKKVKRKNLTPLSYLR